MKHTLQTLWLALALALSITSTKAAGWYGDDYFFIPYGHGSGTAISNWVAWQYANSNFTTITNWITTVSNSITAASTPTNAGALTEGMVFVDPANGNDTTGQRENPWLPFATLTNAELAMIDGDTCVALPADYGTQVFSRSNCTLYAHSGATLKAANSNGSLTILGDGTIATLTIGRNATNTAEAKSYSAVVMASKDSVVRLRQTSWTACILTMTGTATNTTFSFESRSPVNAHVSPLYTGTNQITLDAPEVTIGEGETAEVGLDGKMSIRARKVVLCNDELAGGFMVDNGTLVVDAGHVRYGIIDAGNSRSTVWFLGTPILSDSPTTTTNIGAFSVTNAILPSLP